MMMIKIIGTILILVFSYSHSLLRAQSIIINEIMLNPNGGSLPPSEYVELFNNSDENLNLKDYTYRVGNISVTLPDYFLAPKQYVILASEDSKSAFEPFGNVISPQRWTALNNSSGNISIHNHRRQLIDSISYTNKWYKDTKKDKGGWSIERINPNLTCQLESNWTASDDYLGGTPGRQNSVFNKNYLPSLRIKNFFVNDNNLFVVFNQKTKSLITILENQIHISPNLGAISRLNFIANDTLQITFEKSIIKNKPYQFKIESAQFCSQKINLIDTIFWSDAITYNAVVINEVLFNPRTNGADFVEIYNNSNTIINLQNWLLGNRVIIDNVHLFYPGEYRVLTANTENIILNYPSTIKENIIKMVNIPRYANEQGIVTLSHNHIFVDSLHYQSAMHLPFINNKKGLSLERQDPNIPTNTSKNFVSAATIGEGATPGYENSKYKLDQLENSFFLSSKTVSPDGDAHEDELEINYSLDNSDYMANVSIFSDAGTLVKRLVRNQSMSTNGKIAWNGDAENNQTAPSGIYIYHIELYNAEGFIKTYKNSFVLVRRGSNY